MRRGCLFVFLCFFFLSSINFPYQIDKLIIHNKQGGKVTLIDSSKASSEIGKVISPAQDLNPFLFEASYWGKDKTVVATAANAIHIRLKGICNNDHDLLGSIGFSILPIERHFEDLSPIIRNSSIIADIKAGQSIFRDHAPPVGSRVQITSSLNSKISNELGYPMIGSYIIVKYCQTFAKGFNITFENIKGGKVYFSKSSAPKEQIAFVIKPVTGIGRFGGTEFIEHSVIRACHPAVICISTSNLAERGGFQIIPLEHANNVTMKYAFQSPQYMIVSPLNESHQLAGRSPLFSDFITPGMKVFACFDDDDWETFPQMYGKKDDAFCPDSLTSYFKSKGTYRKITSGLTKIKITSVK